MENKFNWKIIVALILVVISIIIYIINYFIFKNSHDIFFYFTLDIAFLPINVLLVTLLIDTLLNQREKKSMLNKLNMVIGTFFSEVGLSLLKYFNEYDENMEAISNRLMKINNWGRKDYLKFKSGIVKHDSKIHISIESEEILKKFLLSKRDFLLRLLENPNLLEHETFTELLRAVFHLTEEMSSRETFDNQPEADLKHIELDIKRSYLLLIKEWLSYMEYLKDSYPYLYSLALRQNPFNKNSTVIIN
ncbi:MAG: hypothetical protein M1308_09375 [Actinobacteria bacterium]|nr:hypothetical protein [Actinomycetota bacterium]